MKKCHYSNFTQGEKKRQEDKEAVESHITTEPPRLMFLIPKHTEVLFPRDIKLRSYELQKSQSIQTQVQLRLLPPSSCPIMTKINIAIISGIICA